MQEQLELRVIISQARELMSNPTTKLVQIEVNGIITQQKEIPIPIPAREAQ